MEHTPPYIVNSNAPRKGLVPLQARNWPRWICPHCQAQHYFEVDVLMAVTRLTCSTCKRQWNVLIRFESVTAKPRRTLPDYGPTCPHDGTILTDDGACLKCDYRLTPPARSSEDDIITDYDGGGTFNNDEQDLP